MWVDWLGPTHNGVRFIIKCHPFAGICVYSDDERLTHLENLERCCQKAAKELKKHNKMERRRNR